MPRHSIFSSSKNSSSATQPASLASTSRTASPEPTNTSTTFLHHSPLYPSTFTDGLPLPKVLVFDLDYTLWPFWCDTHLTPPVKAVTGRDAGRVAKDRHGESFSFYPDVPGILQAARMKGLKVAAASRTHAPDVAMELLRILMVQDQAGVAKTGGGDLKGAVKPAKDYFDNLQIYPGNKIAHMDGIVKKLGCKYEEMLFFDDEDRNRNVEREKGVCFQLVRDGVTREEIDRGVERWRKARGVSGKREG